MNVIKLAAVLAVPLCISTAALAQEGPAIQADAATPNVRLSRAAVLADLQVWRESGFADAQVGEAPNYFSAKYQAAEARYASMRAAPAFVARVDRIARRRGEGALVIVE